MVALIGNAILVKKKQSFSNPFLRIFMSCFFRGKGPGASDKVIVTGEPLSVTAITAVGVSP